MFETIDEKVLLLSPKFVKQEEYWKKKLSKDMAETVIPADFNGIDRDAPETAEAKEIGFTGPLSHRLITFARNSDLSLYIALLTGLNVLIYRWTGDRDIGVLSPVYTPRATRETINFCVPIRNVVTGDATFLQLLLHTKQSVLEAYENQDYPFPGIVEPVSGGFFSQVSCALENIHQHGKKKMPGEKISFLFRREDGRLTGSLLYDAGIYSGNYAGQLADVLVRILENAMTDIHIKIGGISLLSEEDKQRLIRDFNDNRVDFPEEETLLRLIETHARKDPGRTAVVGPPFPGADGPGPPVSLTYWELNERADRLAENLRARGVREDRTVGIMLERSSLTVESILAVWKAGGAYIPIDPSYPVRRVIDILEDSGTKVLVTRSRYVETRLEDEYGGSVLFPGDRPPGEGKPSVPAAGLGTGMNRLAYVIYTSGSTGRPKGAMVEHPGMMNHLRAKIRDLGLTAASIVAQTAAVTFDISVWQFFAAPAVGGKTVIYPDSLVLEPDRFIHRLAGDGVTVLEVVPSYLSVLLGAVSARQAPPRLALNYLLVTGEEIKPRLVEKWFETYPRVKMVNAYGPTEASDDITHHVMDRAPGTVSVPIGKPLQNLNIYIVDQNMELCPVGVKGEICVSGVGVGRGYLNAPDLTAERFHRTYKSYRTHILYKTGDLGRWLSDGTLAFFGRKDHQVKIRGFRIELGEIENRLLRMDPVERAVVVDREDKKGNRYLCAYFVTAGPPDIPGIKTYLSEHLPAYCIPAFFVPLDRMPLTPNGKIDRKALPDPPDPGAVTAVTSPLPFITEETLNRVVVNREKGEKGTGEKSGEKSLHGETAARHVLSEEEREKVIYSFNRTDTDYPGDRTVSQLFEEQAERTSDSIALIYEDKRLTYGTLKKRADALAYKLRAVGVGAGRVVGLAAERSLEMMVGLLAVLKAGGAYLPVDLEYPAARVAYMLADSGAKVLLTDRKDPGKKISSRVSLMNFDDTGGVPVGDTGSGPADPAYIMYTSGSTGNPKGVIIENKTLVNFIKGMTDIVEFTRDDTVFSLITLCFDIFFLETVLPLTVGTKVVIGGKREQVDPGAAGPVFTRENITVFQATPSMLQLFVSTGGTGQWLKRLRYLLVGGEVFPAALLEKLEGRTTGKIVNLYGPTETTIWSTAKEVTADGTLNIGKPIANTRVYILDPGGSPLPVGIAGELHIGGMGVARGYLNNPELTAERFSRGAAPFNRSYKSYKTYISYRTGDLARWLPGGNIEFLGRIDHQVQLKGIRVEPGEIENILLARDDVRQAAVVVKKRRPAAPGEPEEKLLCAYLVSGKNLMETDLREYLAGELPLFMIPAYFARLEKMPLTAGGKINRPLLEALEFETSPGTAGPSPENKTEEKLSDIWAEVLGLEKGTVGVHSNFFELGGNSLGAAVMIAQIHKAFYVRLSLAEVFRTPTVRGLSETVKGLTRAPYSSIAPVEEKEYYALSPAQKRLFIVQQMKTGNTGYNMPHTVLLKGNLDMERLDRTFRKLIARHETLRTSFRMVRDQPVQVVHCRVEFEIAYHEDAGDGGEIHRFVRPFDLSRAPLLRVVVIKTARERHILLVDVHHIVTDGASHVFLTGEFTALYAGEELPPLGLQYKDYSQWLNRREVKDAIRCQEEYWLRRFRGDIPVLNLPTDFSRPETRGFEGAAAGFALTAAETTALKQLALSRGVTLFMVLMGVYTVFLSKVCGQEDIVVGTPTAGRKHADLARVIGMFVNTLALRSCPSGEKPFTAFLDRVKEHTLDAFENQDYPFEDLVEKVSVERDIGRHPLFDVMFVFQNIPPVKGEPPGERAGDLTIEPYDMESKISKFDLTLAAMESGERLFFSMEYCTGLFREETVARFIAGLKTLISSVLEKPGQEISALEIVPAGEKERLLVEFNRTAAEYPRDEVIHRRFEERAAKTPDAVALAGPGKYRSYKTYVTYKKLNRISNRAAHLLRAGGARPGDITAVVTEPCVEMIAAVLGILKTGGTYLPLDPRLPAARITFMLEDSGGRQAADYMDIETPDADGGEYENPADTALPTDPVYTVYTSGTTGKPKGVLLTHRNLANYVSWFTRTAGLTPGDTALLTSSFAFDLGYTSVYPPLLTGAPVHIVPRETYMEAGPLLNYIRRDRVTYLKVTPSLFSILVPGPGFSAETLRSLRLVVMGGEPIDTGDLEKAHRLCAHIEIINHYGPTEAAVGCIARYVPLDPFDRFQRYKDNPTIGKPIDNTRVYILGKDLNLLPVGVPGELFIAGHGLARGYLNRPELTAERFYRNNKSYGSYKTYISYRTGDRARWMADGSIEFLGRIDEQVKIRGFRVELGEIEYRLSRHREIREAVVIARDDLKGNKNLHAYVVSDGKPAVPELREYLSAHLPEYMVPSHIVFLEKIPLTPNGKIDRKALPAPGIGAIEPGTCTPPRTETEKKVVEIWSEVLSHSPIGIDDNFFQLGGHSLTATILMSKIHREFNVKLPLAEIFKARTVRKLSAFIEQSGEKRYTGIEPVEEKEYYPLSSAQKRLYFLQQMDLNGTGYNVPLVLPLGKDIDKEGLEYALTKLIERHESLRTSFETVNDVPVQKVRKPRDVKFHIEYFSTGQTDGGTLPASFIQRFVRPFDLSRAPLIRSCLVEQTDRSHTWVVDLHHIISDGTSRAILADDFLALYRGEELPPLRLRYKDFSRWQNNLFETGKIRDQEEYWLDIYRDMREIPRLNLPNDFPRPEVFTFKGADFAFLLEGEDAAKFRALGAGTGGTLYMNLLAALNTLFHKYTGSTDIVIGTGIAGRPHADLQGIIGMFVNTLAMRNFPHGEKTYESFLRETIDSAVHAFDNQDVQFEELVERLAPERDLSRNPVFDISLVLQNFRPVGDDAGRFEVIPLAREDRPGTGPEYKNPTTKVDMTFFVHEAPGYIHFNVEYYTGIFREETVKRFASHFKNIIGAVVRFPSVKLKDIELSSPGEKEEILLRFNDTRHDYPRDKTIHRLFDEQAGNTPDAVAVICEENHMSYGELENQSNRLSGYLYRGKGIEPGDRVGLLLDRGVDTAVAILGTLKAGGVYVPIDPSFPAERKKHMVTDSNMGILVTGKNHLGEANRMQWECPCLHTYLCIDTPDIYGEKEGDEDEWMKMNRELWEHVGETSVDDITAGGWLSSYTGEPFTREEMDQYGDNILKKLEPLLHKNMRVLEIGAASGFSMYRLAPLVGSYYGTDLSPVIIEKNRQKIEKEKISNIELHCLPAHEIDRLDEQAEQAGEGRPVFDLIIMNSVIQAFQGYNYLRKVIEKAVHMLADTGYLFVGDIMDRDKKEALVSELTDFKYAPENRDKNYTTKTDFSSELFVSRMFWKDLAVEINEIKGVEFSGKIHTVENELTKFRYDTLIVIDKLSAPPKEKAKYRYQDDKNALSLYDPGAPGPGISSRDLAYIVYTSGTTGKPKGAAVEHRSLVNFIRWRIAGYGYSRQDVTLQLLSYVFDGFASNFYSSLLSGGTLVFIPGEKIFDYAFIAAKVRDRNVTDISLVPGMYESLLEHASPGDLDTLRRVVLGGEKAGVRLVKKSKAVNPRLQLINEYGPTETTVTAAANRFLDETRTAVIGGPISNVRVYIYDDTSSFNLQPVGAVGELFIAGDGLARGYLNNPELTAQRFYRSYKTYKSYRTYCPIYRSGDLARWLPGGSIEFLGRIDRQVKIRGFRIELGEIESRLLNHDLVKEAAVVDRAAVNGEDRYLCAYIVPRYPGTAWAAEELSDYLSGELPAYMIPAHFIGIETIPVTPGGKIDRKSLPAPTLRTAGDDPQKNTAPRDTVQRALAAVWGEVLNIPPASVRLDDNFFRLGGHSLKATVLTAKIHKKLSVKLPLAEVFKNPTLGKQAEYLKQAAGESYVSVEPAEKKEYYPLSSIQKRMYIARQMEINGTSYNMPNVIGLKGRLEVKRLTGTFKRLIKRHESLRTAFVMLENGPVQEIHRNTAFEITAHTGTVTGFVRPFDLSRPPLMRVGLIKKSETSHLLIVDMHHIITDAVSGETLVSDFIALYNGHPLPALPLQYKDFSEWQNRLTRSGEMGKQRAYWLDKFKGDIPCLNMPTDFRRPAKRRIDAGDHIEFLLDEALTAQVSRVMEQTGATLYMVLAAVYYIFLFKYTGDEDIVVGTPIAGRRHADLQKVIGVFLNILAMRNVPRDDKTFARFLEEVKTGALEAYENQDYPFEELVLALGLQGEAARNPLFDTEFAVIKVDPQKEPGPGMHGLTVESLPNEHRFAKFDLHFQAVESGGTVYMLVRYSTELFKRSTVENIREYYLEILRQVVENINITLRDITVSHRRLIAKTPTRREEESGFLI